MNWKNKQRHFAEIRWKKRGHKDILVPPAPNRLPPVKVIKVLNGAIPIVGLAQMGKFVAYAKPQANKTVFDPAKHVHALDRYGEKIVVNKNPITNAWAYISWLEKKGFKRLGAGAYSTVLGKDGSDKVIKVSRSLDNWIDYIQWSAANGYAGNFAPRVYSWKRHP